MDLRVGYGGYRPVGETAPRPRKGTGYAVPTGRQFDQVCFSARARMLESRIGALTAQVADQVRSRPTADQLDALSASIESGDYRPDAGAIAARMMLMEDRAV